eukprot:6183441-Pleurochrysis_carterae.AAC.1
MASSPIVIAATLASGPIVIAAKCQLSPVMTHLCGYECFTLPFLTVLDLLSTRTTSSWICCDMTTLNLVGEKQLFTTTNRFVREVVGIDTRQPGLQEWSPRSGGRDITPFKRNIDNISYEISRRYPHCWIRNYHPTSTRCRFQVGIAADGYLRGAAIAVSQLAERGTPRFTPTFVSYIF